MIAYQRAGAVAVQFNGLTQPATVKLQCENIAFRLSLRGSLRNPVVLLGEVIGRTECCAVVCYCAKRHDLSINHLVYDHRYAYSHPLI
jgi:hypothetical protein